MKNIIRIIIEDAARRCISNDPCQPCTRADVVSAFAALGERVALSIEFDAAGVALVRLPIVIH